MLYNSPLWKQGINMVSERIVFGSCMETNGTSAGPLLFPVVTTDSNTTAFFSPHFGVYRGKETSE